MTEKTNTQETLGGTIGGIAGLFVLFAMIYWGDCNVWTSLIVSLLAGAIIGAMIDSSIKAEEAQKEENGDDDFDLPGFGEPIWESKEGVPVNFAYTNACGKKTKRRVTLHKIFKDSKTRFYFRGYCHLRNEERTFISNNIRDLHDDNGEILDLPGLINDLAGYSAFGSTEVKSVKNQRKEKK